MQTYFDFEIHSKYSRACSKDLDIPHIAEWAGRKGVDVVGTGDFTHPKWLEEIREKLVEDDSGLLRLRKEFIRNKNFELSGRTARFMLSSEISSIYSHNGKTRRIHNLLLAPSVDAVQKIIKKLEAKGAKLGSDGRPIVGLPSKELLRLVLEVSEDCMLIPAHVWTPYFGLFGSMSGYNSVEECFEDLSPHIYALETGLSADPQMFWRISQFDKYALVSCSDAHSLPRIGRECNVFNVDREKTNYAELTGIIKTKDIKRSLLLEYFPEEGRYHFDGHRDCKVSMHPKETKKHNGICPVCGKKLTIGVLSRVEDLADRPEGYVPKQAIASKHFVILEEIIADSLGKGVGSKAVQEKYMRMTDQYPEFQILFDLPQAELDDLSSPEIAEAIIKMRNGQVEVVPGYDGEYGKIKLVEKKVNRSTGLF